MIGVDGDGSWGVSILLRLGEGMNWTPLGSVGGYKSVNFRLIFFLGLGCGGVVGMDSIDSFSSFIPQQLGVWLGEMYGVRPPFV